MFRGTFDTIGVRSRLRTYRARIERTAEPVERTVAVDNEPQREVSTILERYDQLDVSLR